MNPFPFAARHGRLMLVAGLLAGICLPQVGEAMRGVLFYLITLLLFLTMLRVGAQKVTTSKAELFRLGSITIGFQVILPLLLIAAFAALGASSTAFALSLVIMAAAPSISGGSNLAIMVGCNPAPALKLLLAGTLLLPLTIVPIFYFLPAFGSPEAVFFSSTKLLLVIGGTGLAAILIHRTAPQIRSEAAVKTIDGCSAVTMAVLVIGLMPDVGPTLITRPVEFLGWLIAAFTASFGLQFLAFRAMKSWVKPEEHIPFSIVAGCRNNALLLVALPSDIIADVLLFVGCYQIPMYLTPLMLSRLYGAKGQTE